MVHKNSPDHRGGSQGILESKATPAPAGGRVGGSEEARPVVSGPAEGQATRGRNPDLVLRPLRVRVAVRGAVCRARQHLVLTGLIPGRPRFYLEIDIASAGGITYAHAHHLRFLDKADGMTSTGHRLGLDHGARSPQAVCRAVFRQDPRPVLCEAPRHVRVRRTAHALSRSRQAAGLAHARGGIGNQATPTSWFLRTVSAYRAEYWPSPVGSAQPVMG